MKQKQFFIILGAIGFVFLLCWLAVIALFIKNLLGSKNANKSNEPVVVDVSRCDVDASNLCIITFGANNLNRMVINFQLPSADYPAFYIKAANRGIVSVYTCEVAEAVPTSAYCTGIRTPLGETIDIEVYTTDGNKLIARGTFLVSAIALSTPISLTTIPPSEAETPTSSPSPEEYATPTQDGSTYTPDLTQSDSTLTPTPTSTPDIGYPNP